KGAETFERREIDVLIVNPVALPVRERVDDEQIQAGDKHEAHAGDSAQVNLGFQNGEIDQAVAFLLEPQPIHQHANAVGEEGQEDKHEQDQCHYNSQTTIFCHGDSPALSSHSSRRVSKRI